MIFEGKENSKFVRNVDEFVHGCLSIEQRRFCFGKMAIKLLAVI